MWFNTASRAAIDAERDRCLRRRFFDEDGRPLPFNPADNWFNLDPAGGPLELHSPERKLQPAVEPAARPSRTKPKPSFLQSLGEKRLSARFSLAARQDARAESHARFNIKHKLHLNPRQSTLEQTWDRGVAIP
jgi:hypothetical protein